MNEKPKVISTQVVICHLAGMTHEVGDPPAQAVLIVYEDGHVEVRCAHKRDCQYCGYEK